MSLVTMDELMGHTEHLLERVEKKDDFSFEVNPGREEEGTVKIVVKLLTTDSTRDSDEHRKKVTILPGDTYHVNFDIEFDPLVPEDEFYERLLKMMAFVRIHETQEWFRVDGKIFRDPHLVGPIVDVPPIKQRGFA